MCGIAGFVDRSADMRPAQLWSAIQSMTAVLRHRGPDDEGCWVDAQQGVALGHRRLSIIDLSAAGHQPMHSPCGRYVLVFNGEIYNFRNLGRELRGLGERFRGHSDTAVLLAAINCWGIEAALHKLNGMFAFALWDSRERLLHLVRDRLGEKPIYYGWLGETMAFASELKALQQHPRFNHEIDRNALMLYFRHNYIPAPYSIYKRIYKLAPGTIMTLRSGEHSFSLRSYWSARQAAECGASSPFEGSELEAVDQLEFLLRDAVRLRMESDVPLGAFLSGGIDSSLVVALMQANSLRPAKTFTIGFSDPRYDEAPAAKSIAACLGTEHTELYITAEQALAVIPQLPVLYDEPFADSSQIPTFLVSQLASKTVTVSLSGDGGDELFGGYDSYFRRRRLARAIQGIPRILRPSLAKVLSHVARAKGMLAECRSSIAHHLKQGDIEEKLERLSQLMRADGREAWHWLHHSYWIDPASLVVGAEEPPTAFTDSGQWAQLKDFVSVMMYLDTVTYLPDDILVKLDRASMGVSLEARVPILDHRVVEFAWRLPSSMKIKGKSGKEPLRQILCRYVPKQLVDRPKKGFAVPLHDWLRGRLRPWAEALLSERRLRQDGLLSVPHIRQKWEEHISGRCNWQAQLWDVLTFQAWLEGNKPTFLSAGPPLQMGHMAQAELPQSCDHSLRPASSGVRA